MPESLSCCGALCAALGSQGIRAAHGFSLTPWLPRSGAVMPENHLHVLGGGEKKAMEEKNEFAFLHGSRCGKQSC